MQRTAILFVLLLILAAAPAHAAGRWWGGGGIGLSFGGNVDFVSIEPVIGYNVTPKFGVGARLILRYRNDKRYSENVSTSDYGASVFARYFLTKPVFLQGEYEYLSYELIRTDLSTDREGVGSWLGGAGFNQPLGRHASFFVLGLYNFSYDREQQGPYADPWILRIGVGVGF